MQTNTNIQTTTEGIKHPKAVYFLGIGGIGMSALARYYKNSGAVVSGYDRTPTSLTAQLQAEGIDVHFDEDLNAVDKNADFVVYTPAIPENHIELKYLVEHKYPLYKRSEILGFITRDHENICVAGTHGKSTTSAMIAHILRDSGFGCNAFLGAISANYKTNFWSDTNPVCVAEADEFDRSFLKLSPTVAIITSMDADHLDIYGSAKAVQDAFIAFSGKIKPGGCLILKYGLAREDELVADTRIRYALNNPEADAYTQNLQQADAGYRFDLVLKDRVIKNIELPMGGLHNVENMVAAILAALQMKIEEADILRAVKSFAGVKRRFEYVFKTDKILYIDDYAHHPEELRALITGAKALYPNKRCCIIFQPHLFSRTYDFADGFAEVLSLADETVLLPIYPARELPMKNVSSQLILEKLTNRQHALMEKLELVKWLQTKEVELLITAGAGDIDKLVEPIKEILVHKN